jgi:hypothetical protein
MVYFYNSAEQAGPWQATQGQAGLSDPQVTPTAVKHLMKICELKMLKVIYIFLIRD